jgi:hypothetical protein
MKRLLLSWVLLLFATPTSAVDVWTTPYPGVRMLRRNTSQPVVFWALVIDSCAPGVRFRATAPSEGPRSTSSFGRLVGAQMAINGDFADHDFGLNVGDGRVWPYPDTDHSGNFSVGANRIEMTPDAVVLPRAAPWVTEQLGGRWTLLDAGVAHRGIDDNGPASGGFVCAPGLRHPRTAIELSRDRRTVYIVVADGRSRTSIGMTCDELIDVFLELGAYDAMGLDGGGSSTLWRNNEIVNHPSDASGERTVRNHLAVFATGSGAAPHCGLRPTVTEAPQAAPVATATLPAVTALAAPLRFVPVTPTRVFDTRGDSTRLTRGDGSSTGPLTLTSNGVVRMWSTLGAPANTGAVWLNVATVGATVPGFVTVYPGGHARPETSSLNFAASEVVANATPVALSASGVNFDVSAPVDVITDLSGVFTPTGAGLVPIAPRRVFDSRSPAMPLTSWATRTVPVRAPAGAVGVVATVTAVARGVAGYITVHACGTAPPPTSNLNYGTTSVVANAVMSSIGAEGLCLTASSAVDAIVDVSGYLTPTGPLSFVPLMPRRVLDTRLSTTPYTGRVAAGQVLSLALQRAPSMPAGVGAAVVNITVTEATEPGFVRVFPCATSVETSSLHFAPGRATSALATAALSDGALCLAASTRAHVIVDLVGVWVTAPTVLDAGTPRDVLTTVDASLDVSLSHDAAPSLDVLPLRDVAIDEPDVAPPDDVAPPPDDLRPSPGVTCGCRLHTQRGHSAAVMSCVVLAVSVRRRQSPTRTQKPAR